MWCTRNLFFPLFSTSFPRYLLFLFIFCVSFSDFFVPFFFFFLPLSLLLPPSSFPLPSTQPHQSCLERRATPSVPAAAPRREERERRTPTLPRDLVPPTFSSVSHFFLKIVFPPFFFALHFPFQLILFVCFCFVSSSSVLQPLSDLSPSPPHSLPPSHP